MNHFTIPVITALIVISIGSLAGLSFFLQKKTPANSNYNNPTIRTWFTAVARAISSPLLLLLITYAVYFSYILLASSFELAFIGIPIAELLEKLTDIVLVLTLFWFIIRFTNALTSQFYQWATQNNSQIGIIIFPLISNSLKAIAALILINILLPYFAIPAQYLPIVEKSASLLLIAAVTWIILQIINAGEQYLSHHYGMQMDEDLRSRKIYTQVTVLKKITISIVITLALAVALMTFERVRELGTTLLASAGIVAAIGAFAAQKTLSSTFAGLQIALTQPIKINDAVIVENEYGNIEEINLNYVVIKLWDLRRLVVPINYFIEKPFQNWTRNSSNLIGVIMLYVDYSLPIDDVRAKFYEILENSPLWDQKVKALQVTDAKENTIELRLLVSAIDAPKAFDLRCEIREKVLDYIKEKYPNCLPRMRIDSTDLMTMAANTHATKF